MIDSYKFGTIIIDSVPYDFDVIVYKGKVEKWHRNQGHNVDLEDIEKIPEGIDVFVMGNGASGRCEFPEETKQALEKKGIKVIVEMTGDAYQTFNKLEKEGKNVAGGFHLTC